MIQTIPENEFMQVAPLWREYAASHECYDRAYTLRSESGESMSECQQITMQPSHSGGRADLATLRLP